MSSAQPIWLAPAEVSLLSAALDQAQLGLIWVDGRARIRYANGCFRAWGPSALSLADCFEGLSPGQWQERLGHPDGKPFYMDMRMADGGRRGFELRLYPPSAESPPGLITLLLQALDERREHEAIDAMQRAVLEAVAMDRPLNVVMDLLCRRVESLAPDVLCTVLQVDAEGRVRPLAAPGLPASFSNAVDGAPIGPKAGSCGTAAWRRQAVEVTDIGSDPLWDDYRPLAQAHGLAACWSTPILLGPERVAATFALYYREVRPVVPFHRRMVEACIQLCQLALKAEEHQRQIERLAYYDGVTGLANRSLLADLARQMLELAARQDTPACLLLLDLDRFKTINDSLGHATGDEVLREVALRLHPCLRDTDSLARLGGDEFVALLPNCDTQAALRVADKLLAALEPGICLQGRSSASAILLGASIGISTFPTDGQDLDALLKYADIAMYEAKRAGRGCARAFQPSMNRALDERMQLEAGLRQALSAGTALSLHYQPKVRLSDGSLAGVEALLRWQDATRGSIPPDRFIPVAEDCGLINALDAWVLEAACAQLAAWRDQGLALANLAVNVSPLRFYQDNVAAHLGQLLQRHGLQAGQLTLEVTERLMLDEDERTRQQLQQLHAMGVRISVDDFGTGYSSLSYLKRLPVSELKLDKSFVRELETDADDRALAGAVISVGRALGLSVVAEGVETEGQRRVLAAAGCEAAQGWLFARPMPAAAFADWLRERP